LSKVQAVPSCTVRSGEHTIVGGVMSRTVMVWTQLFELPHASVAVQVRAMTFVPPQFVVTWSAKRTVAWLHALWAIATPVTFVVVMAGHSRTRFEGQLIAGGVPRTVMVCTTFVLRPELSVALQVREMTLAPPHPLLTTSL